MQIFVLILYFFIIVGIGMTVVKRLTLSADDIFVGSFVLGSICVGFVIFVLAQAHLIKAKVMFGFLAGAMVLVIPQIKLVFNSIKSFFSPVVGLVYHERCWSTLFSLSIILIVCGYFLLALAPPRSGDAMRYHLAQLVDIVQNNGFVFRPYYHYNFPMYFSMLILPIYTFLNGSLMNIAHTMFFFLSILLILRLASHLQVKYPKLLVYFLLLTPICYLEATKASNDWVLICYILSGMQFLISTKDTHANRLKSVSFAFASLGFALGVKYHAILFLPWFFNTFLESFGQNKS